MDRPMAETGVCVRLFIFVEKLVGSTVLTLNICLQNNFDRLYAAGRGVVKGKYK